MSWQSASGHQLMCSSVEPSLACQKLIMAFSDCVWDGAIEDEQISSRLCMIQYYSTVVRFCKIDKRENTWKCSIFNYGEHC